MHPGQAAVANKFLRLSPVPLGFWQPAREFGNDVAQPVDLLLPGDVADGAAGVLNVLLAVHDLPNRLRFGSLRVPDMNREHDRVLPWVIVEHRLDGRVRQNAAVPVEIAVDAHGWKGWR